MNRVLKGRFMRVAGCGLLLVALKAAMLAAVQDFSFPGGWFPMIGCAMRSMSKWLMSEETEQPFFHCVSCRLPLLEIDAPWLVNKDHFRGECVMEYAVCQPCRDAFSARISEDSKAAVRKFLETKIDWEARIAGFMLMADPTERFSCCIGCETPRELLDGFAISALFDSGGHLVTGPLPLLLCHLCVGHMTATLSDESRAVWKQFCDDHFERPPGDDTQPEDFGGLGIF
jgi:hypothetical protein